MSAMSRTTIGWIWVAGQGVLFLLLILLPVRNDWSTSGLIGVVSSLLFFGGLVIIAIAALRLGTALTPTPVPTKTGTLQTTGLYKFVRHPIYTGVLITISGMALRSGSFLNLAIAVCGFIFFDRKAAWEERQLTEAYPDYPAYAARTGKFFPRP